jgi:hypothetical protein
LTGNVKKHEIGDERMIYRTLLANLTLMMLLIGCRDQNFDIEVERCFFLPKFQKCRCHDYRISHNFTGRVSESRDEPLNYCHKFAGFSPRDTVEIIDLFRQFGDDVETKEEFEKLLLESTKNTHDIDSHHRY